MKQAQLTEPGIRNWIANLLNQYRAERHKVENSWFNLIMFTLLVIITSLVLASRFKEKQDPETQKKKLRDKRKYIVEQVRGLAAISAREGQITGLPAFDYNAKVGGTKLPWTNLAVLANILVYELQAARIRRRCADYTTMRTTYFSI